MIHFVPIPLFRKLDLPYTGMGLLFLAMAVSEYLYPGIAGSGRIFVKVINAFQILYALVLICFTLSFNQLTEPISFSLLVLFFWLCFSGLICSTELSSSLYLLTMYLYWFVMYLFFFTRSRMRPQKTQIFLVLVFFSLFFWALSVNSFNQIAKVSKNLPENFLLQNYVGYYLVALFPFILMLERKSLKLVSFALISYGTIVSLKRGAVLALVLMGFSSSLIYITVLSKSKNKIKILVSILFLWSIAIALVVWFISTNQEAVTRRLHSNTGRDMIYEMAYDQLVKSDFDELLIGHGHQRFENRLGIEPHNDWFLLFYDYGLIGVMAMLNIYIQLLNLLYKLFKFRSYFMLPLISSIILMACLQLYSIGLNLKIFGIITANIGLVAGKYKVLRYRPPIPKTIGRTE